MAGNLKHAGGSLGPKTGDDQISPHVEETALLTSEIFVFEQWLKAHLRTLYQDVLGEPLPSDLSDIVERFTSDQHREGAECAATTDRWWPWVYWSVVIPL